MQHAHSSTLLSKTLDILEQQAPKIWLRAKSFVSKQDALYWSRGEAFLSRYARFLSLEGLSFSEGVESFIRLQHIVEFEREKFLATGRYPNTSFDAVNQSFYSNPELMRHHMHGLVFAQFLWPDQYHRFAFFADHLGEYATNSRAYLEVGGGHALYLCEAQRAIGGHTSIQVVDISETSMGMAKSFAASDEIQFHLMNIFDFPDVPAFDFITMGEVLEHVEEPTRLLEKLRCLLRPGGKAFITTPANAPMPDHIYLFHNADEIRSMLVDCGFRIEIETTRFAVDVPQRVAEKLRLPLMYAAFVSVA